MMHAPGVAARIVHADHVLLGDSAPLRDGAVVLSPDGTVLDVGRADEIRPRHAGPPVERIEGIAFPGLINAHAHLELSALRGRVPGGRGFLPWVDALLALRLDAAPEESDEALEQAASELHAFGTAAVGEVTNSLAAVDHLLRRGIQGSIFYEIFGIGADVVTRTEAMLAAQGERTKAWGPALTYVPTAHTLHTTRADAVRKIAQHAKHEGLRTSLHLAEHAAERRALEHGDGPVTDWLRGRVRGATDIVWPKQSPIAYADALGALGPHMLLVHLTDARPEELQHVAGSGAKVVLCPRSNLHIEGLLPPLLAVRAAGIEPALGTDSLASNASLDVLAEARALADRFPTVPAAELVRMATYHGAQALGRPHLGRIARGARPGIVAVDVPGAAQSTDGAALLLRHVKAPRRWLAAAAAPIASIASVTSTASVPSEGL
ncbi:amidohydrolase family protein [Pendulispora albinea]|uniref:Amidohydrolase family protein n=1 Tax=Pendulispora albinea TaxID=2741071 RepID=A0ABZ2LN20_9BACT